MPSLGPTPFHVGQEGRKDTPAAEDMLLEGDVDFDALTNTVKDMFLHGQVVGNCSMQTYFMNCGFGPTHTDSIS